MSIDLTKLTPAPWQVRRRNDEFDFGVVSRVVEGGVHMFAVCRTGNNNRTSSNKRDVEDTDAEFIALARNAFDVMTRRLWRPVVMSVCLEENNWVSRNKWCVGGIGLKPPDQPFYDDPFTALVEADKWYRENIEKR